MENLNNLICTGCKIKLKLPPNFGEGKNFNCPKCSTLLTSPSLSVQPTSSSKSENNLICSGCNAKLKLPASFGAGKNFNCPKCSTLLTSPSFSVQPTSSSKSENNVICNGCNAKIKLPASFGAGKNFNCPKCSTLLTLPAKDIPNNDILVPAKNLCVICKKEWEFASYCKWCEECIKKDSQFIHPDWKSSYESNCDLILCIINGIKSTISKIHGYEAAFLEHDIIIKNSKILSDIAKKEYFIAKEKVQNIKSKPAENSDLFLISQVENQTIQAVRLGFQVSHEWEKKAAIFIEKECKQENDSIANDLMKHKGEQILFRSTSQSEKTDSQAYGFKLDDDLTELQKLIGELEINIPKYKQSISDGIAARPFLGSLSKTLGIPHNSDDDDDDYDDDDDDDDDDDYDDYDDDDDD